MKSTLVGMLIIFILVILFDLDLTAGLAVAVAGGVLTAILFPSKKNEKQKK